MPTLGNINHKPKAAVARPKINITIILIDTPKTDPALGKAWSSVILFLPN